MPASRRPVVRPPPRLGLRGPQPEHAAVDLTDKRRIYADAGVEHLWFVDPIARTLEAFALTDGAWTLLAALKDDEEVRVPPFDAIAFPLSVLWPD